jgi:hypothetical protein
MSVTSEIERIKTNIANAYTAIEEKGVITTNAKNSDNLASTISAIKTGGTGGGDGEFTPYENGFIEIFTNGDGSTITELPYNAIKIPSGMFSGKKNINLTSLPETITTINSNAFYGCTNLKITKIPNGVTQLLDYTFYNCENMPLAELPSGLIKLGPSVFYNCKKLELTELPKTITSFGKSCFQNCTSLKITEVWGTSPNSGQYNFIIPQYCYYGCTSLKSIKIIEPTGNNNTKTIISEYCFQNCTGLELVDFGEKTYSAASSSFSGCTSLKTLICRRTSPPTIQSTTFTNAPLEEIFVPDEKIDTYKSASNWSKYASLMKPLSEYGG